MRHRATRISLGMARCEGAVASNWLPRLDITSVDYSTSIIAGKRECQRNHFKLDKTKQIGCLRGERSHVTRTANSCPNRGVIPQVAFVRWPSEAIAQVLLSTGSGMFRFPTITTTRNCERQTNHQTQSREHVAPPLVNARSSVDRNIRDNHAFPTPR